MHGRFVASDEKLAKFRLDRRRRCPRPCLVEFALEHSLINREVLGDPLDMQAAQVCTCVLLIEVRVNFSGKLLDATKVV